MNFDAHCRDLVDSAYRSAGGDLRKCYQLLLEQAKRLKKGELLHFALWLTGRREKLYSPKVLCAAYLIAEGWFSEDNFLDFTDCLAVAESDIFDLVVEEPDNLIDYPNFWHPEELYFHRIPFEVDPEIEFEVSKNVSLKTVKDIFFNGKKGLKILSHESAQQLTPRIYQKFGEKAFEDL